MLLFRNSLRGLNRQIKQFIGLVCLLLLATTLYTAFTTSNDTIQAKLDDYAKTQNVEDLNVIPRLTLDQKMLSELFIENKVTPQDQQKVFNKKLTINQLIDLYHIDMTPYYEDSFKASAKKYDLSYEARNSVMVESHDHYYKFFETTSKIDKPYLQEGRLPKSDQEMTLSSDYARLNDISLNDQFKINDQEYTVVGFTYVPDYVYPLVSYTSPMYKKATNSTGYMTSSGLKRLDGIYEGSLLVTSNKALTKQERHDLTVNLSKQNDVAYATNRDDSFTFGSITMRIEASNVMSKIFMTMIVLVASFVILLLVKKRIDNERIQIGLLKALGYRSGSIATSYLVYAIFSSLIAGVIGYFIGINVADIFTNLSISTFDLPIPSKVLDYQLLAFVTFMPLIVLSVLSFVIALLFLRQKPLKLLYEGTNNKVTRLSKMATKMLQRFSFETRFKYSLALRSSKKMLAIFFASLCASFLLVFILIASPMFDSMLAKTFNGLDYNYKVSLNQISDNYKLTSSQEPYMETNLNLIGIDYTSGESRDLVAENAEKGTIPFMMAQGIKPNSQLVNLKDPKGNHVEVENNKVVVNMIYVQAYNLKVGDKLTFQTMSKKQKFTLEVSGISDDFNGPVAYFEQSNLNKLIGYGANDFNGFYSKDEVVKTKDMVSIFKVQDMKDNMADLMKMSKIAMSIDILFAGIMTAIVISLISSMVVDENKRNISTLKVFGYRDKEINQLVLNIYTPFVVAAYFIAIPLVILTFKAIASYLALKYNMAIAITVDYGYLIIGLGIILIIYYFSLLLSKKSVKRIALAQSLKRE